MTVLYYGQAQITHIRKIINHSSTRQILQQIIPVSCIHSSKNFSSKTTSEQNSGVKIEDDTLSWEHLVDYSKLSPMDIKIHGRHLEAVKNNKLSYTDPSTGYLVFTRLSHLSRGTCCGNACRHCPYGQRNVPDNMKKLFNSAFYS